MIEKNSKLIMAVVAFLIGLLVGQNFGQVADTIKKSGIIPSPTCQYEGKSYKSGESFPATDGCNSCGCNDGQVACTLMACER